MPKKNLFVPKDLDSRKVELDKRNAIVLKQYNSFLYFFKNNMAVLRNTPLILIDDKLEYELIRLLQLTKLYFAQDTNPFKIFICQDNPFMFGYDWLRSEFAWDRDLYKEFQTTFNLSDSELNTFIKIFFKKYFNIVDVSIYILIRDDSEQFIDQVTD